MARHRSLEELQEGLGGIMLSPRDAGTLKAIVIRPETDGRISLPQCDLSPEGGVHGDNWAKGCWMSLPDGRPHPDVQVTIMNARTITLIAQRGALAARRGQSGHRSGSQRRESAARDPALGRLRAARDHRGAAQGLPQVRGTLRRGRHALRQFQGRSAPASARHLRQDRRARGGDRRRYRHETVAASLLAAPRPRPAAGPGADDPQPDRMPCRPSPFATPDGPMPRPSSG